MGSLFTGRRKQFIEKFFERHRRKLLQFDGAELADCTAAKLAVTFQCFRGATRLSASQSVKNAGNVRASLATVAPAWCSVMARRSASWAPLFVEKPFLVIWSLFPFSSRPAKSAEKPQLRPPLFSRRFVIVPFIRFVKFFPVANVPVVDCKAFECFYQGLLLVGVVVRLRE